MAWGAASTVRSEGLLALVFAVVVSTAGAAQAEAPSALAPALAACDALAPFVGEWNCGGQPCIVTCERAENGCRLQSECAPAPLEAIADGVCAGEDGTAVFLRTPERLDWSTAKGTFVICRKVRGE